MKKARSNSVRVAALRKGSRQCLRCDGKTGIQVHHIVALADGGKDVVENTVLLCVTCHRDWHQRFEGRYDFDKFAVTPPNWLINHFLIEEELENATINDIYNAWLRYRFEKRGLLINNRLDLP